MGLLLEHLPSGLHPVLASRADPPLALARLRARGQLTELRDAELRFTAGEAADVLRETSGAELPDAAVTALVARTEGWAAGLQLAALSLRGQADVAEFVAAFTGSHRYVLDYLAEEVLERQGEQMRDFLLETAVLDRLSGPLCDAVTGRGGSQALLEQVERAGLFLMPLDEVRGWWRYHQLFADLLRARLQEQPERAAGLHRKAAAWFREHGLADDAIRHAVAAGEMLWAVRLIEQDFDAAYNLRGEGETIQRWLSALPADLVRSRPRLLLAQAQLRGTSGHLAELEQLIDAAERVAANGSGEPFEPTAGPAASLLVNVPAHMALERAYLAQLRGDAEGTAAFSSRALAESRAGESLLTCTVQGFLAVAEWLRGRLAEAEGAFTSGVAGWRAAGLSTHAAWGGYSLAQMQCGQGRLDAAIRTCQQALEAAEAAWPTRRPTAGLAYVGLGGVAYQRNELDLALRHVTAGIPLCRRSSTPRRWHSAWPRWPGSGKPALIRPEPWPRWTRPCRPRQTPPDRSIPSRRNGPGCSARSTRRPHARSQIRRDRGRPGIVEPLTCRELEVLGMLAAGQSNQAIASQLVVTLDTVKKHVSHVLSKLGAANRTEAVSRARRLDLIP